jgi:hypothetical protein
VALELLAGLVAEELDAVPALDHGRPLGSKFGRAHNSSGGLVQLHSQVPFLYVAPVQ